MRAKETKPRVYWDKDRDFEFVTDRMVEFHRQQPDLSITALANLANEQMLPHRRRPKLVSDNVRRTTGLTELYESKLAKGPDWQPTTKRHETALLAAPLPTIAPKPAKAAPAPSLAAATKAATAPSQVDRWQAPPPPPAAPVALSQMPLDEQLSDALCALLVKTAKKFLVHPDIAKFLYKLSNTEVPDVQVMVPAPTQAPVVQPASPARTILKRILVIGADRHIQADLNKFVEGKLQLRFWFDDGPANLNDKAVWCDMAICKMERCSHATVGVLKVLNKKHLAITGATSSIKAALEGQFPK